MAKRNIKSNPFTNRKSKSKDVSIGDKVKIFYENTVVPKILGVCSGCGD